MVKTRRGQEVRIAGLSTVWVSDSSDGGGANIKPGAFDANMVVGGYQIERAVGENSVDKLLILLTHHPMEWLRPASRAILNSSIAPTRHVHLCGHIHEVLGTSMKRVGDTKQSVTFVAGAAHSEPQLNKHGYSWGGLSFSDSRNGWNVGWGPRTYVAELGECRAESTRFNLPDQGVFAWEEIQ